MPQFDPRIIQIGVEVNGQIRFYDGLSVTANISKNDNGNLSNEATISLTGLAKEVRNQLLTETSPYNLNYTPKRITVRAGRQSTGVFTLFDGDICDTDASQPPDIEVTIKAKTLSFQKTEIIAKAYAQQTKLSVIAKGVADQLGLSLVFEATERNIGSFSFTGASAKLVGKLSEMGGVNAYVDDKKLVVKNFGVPLMNVVHTLSEKSGLIGVPELTDQGVRVKYLLDPKSQLGGTIDLVSEVNPALTGKYTIFQLWYVIASRDTAFYTIAECYRPGRRDMTGFIPFKV